MWSEAELLSFIMRLVHICATLQKINVAHRNIKPANLVFSQTKGPKTDTINFDHLLICNFEMATCFEADSHYHEHICTQDQECSAIYASPVVQQMV
jgi:serine/threonine protein kinase